MEGETLQTAFPAGMPEQQVLRLAKDVADALTVWAGQGTVHEAVKPQNVFVTADGGFRLGEPDRSPIACGGDLSCMSPEMYWGMRHDGRADVYALGLLLYTMLNEGVLPLAAPGADGKTACLRRLEGEELPPPKTGSKELQQVVLKACAYEPKDRYDTAEALRAALG